MADQQTQTHPEPPLPNQSTESSPAQSVKDSPVRKQPLWLVVVASSVIFFFTFGFLAASGTFQLYYYHVLLSNHGNSAISWILTSQLFIFCSSSIVWARVPHKQWSSLTLFSGVATCNISMLLLGSSTMYYQVYLSQGVMFGMGLSLIGVSTLPFMYDLFQINITAAFIPLTAICVGGMGWPFILKALLEIIGFRGTMSTVGIAGFVLGLPSCYCLSHNLKKRGQRSPPGSFGKTLSTLRDPALTAFIVGNGLIMWGLLVPFFYLPLYAFSSGSTESNSNATVAMLNLGVVVGGAIAWSAASWLGHFNTFTASAFLGALVTDIMFLGLETPHIMGLSFLFGYCAGGVLVLNCACVELLVRGRQSLSAAHGLLFLFSSMTLLTGNPIAGALIEAQSSFQGLIIFTSLAINMGAVIAFISRMLVSSKIRSTV